MLEHDVCVYMCVHVRACVCVLCVHISSEARRQYMKAYGRALELE